MDVVVVWFQPVIDWFIWLAGQWQSKFLFWHIIINTVAAVAVSLYTKTFQLGKLWEFLYRKLLPYIMLYVVLAAGGEAIGQPNFAIVVWGVITSKLLTDLLDSAKQLLINLQNGGPGEREVSWLK
jgi:hypothetical protein